VVFLPVPATGGKLNENDLDHRVAALASWSMTGERLFKSAREWRAWLREHHTREREIWVLFYKKKCNRGTLDYGAAVAEALCWGWIDSTMRRVDDERHKIRFTPRRPNSVWSTPNKEKVAALTAAGKMTKAGLRAVEIAKENGRWHAISDLEAHPEVPADLAALWQTSRTAQKAFSRISPSLRKQYLWWLASAKRPGTRQKRLAAIVRKLEDAPTS
jgi:uncharacterized protein YdeI (YjbR/CyaY-like superfamily)